MTQGLTYNIVHSTYKYLNTKKGDEFKIANLRGLYILNII